MNYINRPKSAYTQEEWIKYLEESIRELRKEKENLKKEKGEIRQRLVKLEKVQAELSRVKENKELREHKENLIRADKRKSSYIEQLEEENKKLKKECEENDYLVEDNAINYWRYNKKDLTEWWYMRNYQYRTLESSLKDESELESFILDNIKVDVESK